MTFDDVNFMEEKISQIFLPFRNTIHGSQIFKYC